MNKFIKTSMKENNLNSKMTVEIDRGALEAETSYYLLFHIDSALISIHFLTNTDLYCESVFLLKPRYYHFYSDHLFFSWGQIVDRFHSKSRDESIISLLHNNRMNYHFDENKYQLLSDKTARNFVEHINERNITTIKEIRGVGGFNSIDFETDEKFAKDILGRRNSHNYIFDYCNRMILIYNQGASIDISIDELREELIRLRESVINYEEAKGNKSISVYKSFLVE